MSDELNNKKSFGQRLIRSLKDFSARLQASGGDIDKTGLRVTRVSPCPCRQFNYDGLPIPGCNQCDGIGFLRETTINGVPTDA